SAPLSVVSEVTPRIEAMAGEKGPLGRGGMASKLMAARIATQSGSFAVIASGNRPDTIRDILAGEDIGTLFLPSRRLASRKRWIAFASSAAGRISVNEGARSAICDRGSSLLFAGVSRLDGEFHRGDVVSIVADRGGEFARGITNYDASEARPLIGKRSEEIFRIVGRNFEELINRDNLVVR
ncbi:MAG: glutamate 5-kinase, partial [Planctomycetes bacterium]|nr:glutamate 5-kinase [Planctomycetota bacterium]